jgi:Na+-driven multidrug efflux pump
LIPRLGGVGAAWGTFIAFGFMLAVTMAVVWRRRATE